MTNCPRDRHKLVLRTDGLVPVWFCNVCSGGFVAALPKGTPTQLGRKREEWDSPIACPKDGAIMVPILHHHLALDSCPRCHGVWLDGGEVPDVLGKVFLTPTPRKKRTKPGVLTALLLITFGLGTLPFAADILVSGNYTCASYKPGILCALYHLSSHYFGETVGLEVAAISHAIAGLLVCLLGIIVLLRKRQARVNALSETPRI